MCSKDPNVKGAFTEGSLINQSNKLVATLYENPPANTGIWIADVASNIGIIPKTYAQGIGFSVLSPLLSIWKVSRNVAYALLIVVLLAIGLMIMFRTKIDPRTVISIQAALPRIVITLILITFSYPIAALMIDLMYVVLFLGISLMGPVSGLIDQGNATQLQNLQAEFATGGGLWRIFYTVSGEFWAAGTIGLGIGILSLIVWPLTGGLGAVGGAGLKAGLGSVWGLGLGGQLTQILGGTSGILMLIVLVIFFFAIMKIWFMLLNAYINLLISIIFGPILILGEAIPGQPAFSNWLKNIIANAVVFPATAILIVVANAVSYNYRQGGATSWSPPLLGFGEDVAQFIIGMGFALVIPQVVGSIKKMFGAKAVIPLGGAIGQTVGAPVGVVQQIMQTVGSYRMAFGGGKKTS